MTEKKQPKPKEKKERKKPDTAAKSREGGTYLYGNLDDDIEQDLNYDPHYGDVSFDDDFGSYNDFGDS